jgi:hypothetical protein
MPAGTSLGSGIALQSGNRNDYWMRKLADDWAARRAATAKAEQEKKKQAADNQKWFLGMLTVPEGMAPMMMKRAWKEIESAYTQAEGGFESGDLSTLHKIITTTKKNVSNIKTANDQAVAWFNDPNSIYPPEQKTTFWSDDGEIDDMKPFNNYLAKFPLFGDDYSVSVSSPVTKKFEIPLLKVDDYEYLNVDKSGKLVKPESRLGGTLTNVYKKRYYVSDKQKQEVYNNLMNDLDWVQSRLSIIIASKPKDEIAKLDLNRAANETPQEFLARNSDVGKQLDAMTREFIDRNSEKDRYDDVTGSIPQAKEKKDKDDNVVVIKHDTNKTMANKNIRIVRPFTPEEQAAANLYGQIGGLGQEDVPTKTEELPFTYDAEIDVSNSGPTTITITPEMIQLNPELDGMQSITFNPGTMYKNTDDGKWYVRGIVNNYYMDNDPLLLPNERQMKITTLDPLVPLENIYPKIRSKYKYIDNYTGGDGGTVPSQPGSNKGNAPSGGTAR